MYGLSGTTPVPVKANLFGSLAVEALVAVVTASTRLYSTLSFGILGLLWGLGLAGLWGARYGAFPPRPPDRSMVHRLGHMDVGEVSVATTKSRSFSVRVLARVSRANDGTLTTPTASIALNDPGPRIARIRR